MCVCDSCNELTVRASGPTAVHACLSIEELAGGAELERVGHSALNVQVTETLHGKLVPLVTMEGIFGAYV